MNVAGFGGGRIVCVTMGWWPTPMANHFPVVGKPSRLSWVSAEGYFSFTFFANQCCTQLWDKGILFLSLVCAQNHFEWKLLGPINGCSCRSWPGQCRDSLLLLRIHVAVQRVWEFGMGPTVFVWKYIVVLFSFFVKTRVLSLPLSLVLTKEEEKDIMNIIELLWKIYITKSKCSSYDLHSGHNKATTLGFHSRLASMLWGWARIQMNEIDKLVVGGACAHTWMCIHLADWLSDSNDSIQHM